MKYDFDRVIDRRDSGSIKWDRFAGRDVIPMWVADMDFRSPPEVLEALHRQVDHGVFGYAHPREELVEVVVERLARRHHWEIDPDWIVWLPGVGPGLHMACRAAGSEGDEVLTFVPVYPPFLSAPRLSQRKLKTIALCRIGDSVTLDIEGLREAITPQAKLLLLCNPHNPVGRVYTREELKAVAEVCLEHDIILCSDEIHCDLILDEKEHVSTATLSDEIGHRTITLMSPSKTFNLAGLNCAFAVIANDELRSRFRAAGRGLMPDGSALGFSACLAAYRDGEEWRGELVNYLRENRDMVHRFINEETEQLSMDQVEATYLGWINAEQLQVADPVAWFERAGVGAYDGRRFQGEGHVRLNFGCPRKVLWEALDRIKEAIGKHSRQHG